MELVFWGSTDDVTGSMTYLRTSEGQVLIDCGLVQGTDQKIKNKNNITQPVKPSELTGIIITHAHLDHSGLIPRMVREGFRGRIYCTPATSRLMQIILLDSAKLNAENNFYDTKDVSVSIPLIKTVEWNEEFDVIGVKFHFISSLGDILGASSLVSNKDNKTIVFSGDLGRFDDPILLPHTPCPEADIVVMESTYGDRLRNSSIEEELEKFLTIVAREKRVGIMASFAVARAQTLLTLIHRFHENNSDQRIRVVMDSPMMKAANGVYKRFKHLTNHGHEVFEALEEIDAIEYQKEWDSLRKKSGPLVIVTSSGMLTGGRIGRHLLNWHNDKKAILFLTGYQGVDTPGRGLLDGSRKLVGPDEEEFEWQGEVWHTDAFSSHADQNELVEWVKPSRAKRIFLLHGNDSAKNTLALKLKDEGFKNVTIPSRGEVFDLKQGSHP